MKLTYVSLFCLLSHVSLFAGATLPTPSAFAAPASFADQAVDTVGDASALQFQSSRVAGSGAFVFSEPLSSIGSDSSHALSFFLQDGGSLKFMAYGMANLAGGLEFTFTRAGKTLNATVSKASGLDAHDVSFAFTGFDASRVVDLQLDVHNSENPAHLLIWNGIENDFSEDTALANSEEHGFSNARGEGMLRGFVLKNAVLFKATASKVKLTHDH